MNVPMADMLSPLFQGVMVGSSSPLAQFKTNKLAAAGLAVSILIAGQHFPKVLKVLQWHGEKRKVSKQT